VSVATFVSTVEATDLPRFSVSIARIAGALLMAVVASSCATPVTASTSAGPGATADASASPEVGERQQHEAGSVTVTASWMVGTSSVLVGMNTHSVDLDGFDLKELARVRLDGGAWASPTGWDAPKGGHHRGGTLSFGSLDPRMLAFANVIELEIRDVAVPSHLLRWERAR